MRTDVFGRSHRGLQLAGLIGSIWLLSLAFALSLDLSRTSPLLTTILVLLRAFLHTGLFIVAHDAMHGSLAPGRSAANRIIGTLCLILYAGLCFQCCLRNHSLHHHAAETSDDPDFRSQPEQSVISWYWQFLNNYLNTRQIVTLASIWLVYYKLAGFTNPQPVTNLLVFCVLPLILSSLQLFIIGTWLPHNDNASESGTNGPKSLRLHPVLSFAACYHFGYHSEHHGSPSTPWFLLPQQQHSMPHASCKTELLGAPS